MQLGDSITKPGEPMGEWHFVEGDIYNIAQRVQEYDSLARLVYNKTVDKVGVAREVPSWGGLLSGKMFMVAFELDQSRPDARVIQAMREKDNRTRSRYQNLNNWYRDLIQAGRMDEERIAKEMRNAYGEEGERLASTLYKDKGRGDRAFISRGLH